mmetsp:Transcript_33231/g.55627  ORF Transcript_33231/g.55627 Transcript_33231/m.55627 type:complete len:201 (+) Transcript_33231:695-1297(+)
MNHASVRNVSTPGVFQSLRNLTQCASKTSTFDAKTHEVIGVVSRTSAVTLAGTCFEFGKCFLCQIFITRCFDRIHTGNLLFSNVRVIDLKNVYSLQGFVLFAQAILVYTHDSVYTGINSSLFLCGTLFNHKLGLTVIDKCCHSTIFFDLIKDVLGFEVKLIRERFHHVASSPRICNVADSCFFLENQLCVSCNSSGLIRW